MRSSAGRRNPLLDEHDESLDDLLVGEITLAEDGQDVLDPGPGGFAEEVFPPNAVEVFLDRSSSDPSRRARSWCRAAAPRP